jgi:Ser/Thr protein kinase RdoA (MazF antagonist)
MTVGQPGAPEHDASNSSKTARVSQLVSETRFSELQGIVERYPPRYHLMPAQTPQPARGFSGARLWKIATPAGFCALRAMRGEMVDKQRLAGLHRLVNHVRSCGVAEVPVPIATTQGTTFFEHDGNVWQLEPWMSGTADFAALPNRARLRAALQCLSRWHLAAAQFRPHNAERTWFSCDTSGPSPGLAERFEKIGRWDESACAILRQRLDASPWKEFAELGHEILNGFSPTAHRIAVTLRIGLAARVPLQPCLRDVWHDHVLFTGDAVTGLIDAHAARSDSVVTDVARLLGSLAGDDRSVWDAGLDAYQQVRSLSPAELALVEVFDQTGVLLSGMTWLEWHCLDGRTFDDREKVIARLRTIVDRLKNLALRLMR